MPEYVNLRLAPGRLRCFNRFVNCIKLRTGATNCGRSRQKGRNAGELVEPTRPRAYI